MELTVVQGDIAEQEADALVNAAGTSLRMGSGVAGALLHAADGPLERAAVARGPIELGEVVVTDAYGLDAEHVIHAAAMSHSGPHRLATAESIRDEIRAYDPTALEDVRVIGYSDREVELLERADDDPDRPTPSDADT